MPIYTYRCPKCGDNDHIVSIENRDLPFYCDCGELTTRIMAVPQPPKVFISTKEKCFISLNSPGCTIRPEHRKQTADGWDYVRTVF